MFVQRTETGAVTGWGTTLNLPDGTTVREGDPAPVGWVWDATFDPSADPGAVVLTDMQAQLVAQQATIDQLLDALAGGQ